MSAGEIIKSLIVPDGTMFSDSDSGNNKNGTTKSIINKLYPLWLQFQAVFGTCIYLGSLPYPNPMELVAIAPFLYILFNKLGQRLAFFGSNMRIFPLRVLFIAATTAAQVGVVYLVLQYEPYSVLVVIIGFGIVFWMNRKPRKGRGYIKGAKRLTFQEAAAAHEAMVKPLIESGKHPREFMNFAGITLTSLEATLGFFFLGETRSGKSLLISMLLPILQYENKRAIIYDYAGNFLAKLLALNISRERIIILNPLHADCYEWLLSHDMTNPAVCLNFAQKLFPKGTDSKENYFKGYAARVVAAVMDVLNRVARDQGILPTWGMKELVFFCSSRKKLYDLFSVYEDVAEEFEEFKESGNETVTGVMSTFLNDLMPLKPAAECWYRARQLGRTITLGNFSNDNKILLLGRDAEKAEELLNFFNTGVINFCVSSIVGKPTSDDTKPASTFFIGDEFQTLGKIDKLPTIATEGGKYGFCAILASQSLKKLQKEYGEANFAQLFGCITHRAILKVTEAETARYISESFGDTTAWKLSTGYNQTTNYKAGGSKGNNRTYQQVTERLFTPGHFQSQTKINMAVPSSVMKATVRCDDMNYCVNFRPDVIVSYLPPKPTAEQERECIAPQDESMMFFQPLDDSELENLGLIHMMKNPPPGDFDIADDIEYGAYEMFQDMDLEDLEE